MQFAMRCRRVRRCSSLTPAPSGLCAAEPAAHRVGARKCRGGRVPTRAWTSRRPKKISTGHTPLHIACQEGSTEVAACSLMKPVPRSTRGLSRASPLSTLRCKRESSPRHAMTKLLLQRGGATVDIEDNTGRSPLHLAAQNCAAGLVEALLAGGASVDRESSRGLTALECAIYGATSSWPQFHTTIEVLLARGAAFSKTHKWNGQTALHAVAYLGRQELVARGAAKDEAFYLQTGDGLINQVRSMEMAYEAQAAAYGSARRPISWSRTCGSGQPRHGWMQARVAAHHSAWLAAPKLIGKLGNVPRSCTGSGSPST